MMVRVVLPTHLYRLASSGREVQVQVEDDLTLGSVLDALEQSHPMLRGTIREQNTKQRRPFIRFFACGEDLSHEPADTPLQEAVIRGDEPLRIVGAMAGG
jgi:molybdopterin synthase sulfur carrier subunit